VEGWERELAEAMAMAAGELSRMAYSYERGEGWQLGNRCPSIFALIVLVQAAQSSGHQRSIDLLFLLFFFFFFETQRACVSSCQKKWHFSLCEEFLFIL